MSNRKISYGLFKHWIPDLKDTKNKSVFVAKQCPICDMEGIAHSRKAFRLNLKLGVFKCYVCGRGGITDKKLIRYIKRFKKTECLVNPVATTGGCLTETDSELPF